MTEREWETHWKGTVWEGREPSMLSRNRESYEELVPEILYYGGSILDAGCGVGNLFDCLKEFEIDYTGIDISKPSLDEFKRVHPKVNLHHGSCIDLPFESKSFNIVVIAHVLEHLHPNEYSIALREASRVAKEVILISWFKPPRHFAHITSPTYYTNQYDIEEVKNIIWQLKRFKSLNTFRTMPYDSSDREIYVIELDPH